MEKSRSTWGGHAPRFELQFLNKRCEKEPRGQSGVFGMPVGDGGRNLVCLSASPKCSQPLVGRAEGVLCGEIRSPSKGTSGGKKLNFQSV